MPYELECIGNSKHMQWVEPGLVNEVYRYFYLRSWKIEIKM